MKTLPAALSILVLAIPTVCFAQSACENPDSVRAFVEEGNVVVVHENAVYNCCPDEFRYEVEEEEETIRIWEYEVLTTPCDCICCYLLGVTVGDVAPGDHWVEFWWLDENAEWTMRTIPVHVREGPPAERADIVSTYSSGCLSNPQNVPEAGEPDDETPGTWGRIKALFDAVE